MKMEVYCVSRWSDAFINWLMTGAFVCFLKPYISIVTIPPPFLSLKTLNEGDEEG
ncbi:hypothetical protein Hdeb2414_s0002g00070211 [Helianthus debilis subsp. tardiflorus]